MDYTMFQTSINTIEASILYTWYSNILYIVSTIYNAFCIHSELANEFLLYYITLLYFSTDVN